MKNIITLSLTIILTACLASCMTDFEPDIESTPVVCINADAVAGDTLIVDVTRTWRWSEGDPYEGLDINLKNADVEVWVNGELRCRPAYSTWAPKNPGWFIPQGELTEGYKTDYVPSVGDHICIKVHDAEYGDAEGEVSVPIPTKIDGVDFSTVLTDEPDGGVVVRPWGDQGDGSGNIKHFFGNVALDIRLTDPDDIKNYYKLEMSLQDRQSESNLIAYTNFDFSHEPLFTEHVSSLESVFSDTSGYSFFSDRQISGVQYGLRMELIGTQYYYLEDEGAASNQAYVKVKLRTISESYYKHVISMWECNDGVPGALGGVGLGDPVWTESNVSTGAGVISASSWSEYSIPIADFFGVK